MPVGEFKNLLASLDERIVERDAEADRAQAASAQLRSEKATIEQALAAREQLLEARERERNQTSVVEPAASKVMSPQRKRAAVLRAIEDNPGQPQTPASVRAHLARVGLIDPENETGTPVRIILAQMREAGVLVRTGPGEYRLKTRDEQVAASGSD